VLISELSVTTDRHSEYALMIEVRMQEVILVKPAQDKPATAADQAAPQKTTDTTDAGSQQAAPTDQSWISRVTGWKAPINPNPSP
jgi:hypothetical protein